MLKWKCCVIVKKKTLEIYHNDGHEKAWNYWSLIGHKSAIFLGEIPSSEFITGDELGHQLGITHGTSLYSDTPWLKFILDGNIIIIPMKPIMCNVSWEHIYQAGAVYGTDTFGSNPSGGDRLQDVMVTIDGYEFKVTLLKGSNSDPTPDNPSIVYNQWASYSDDDLIVDYRSGNGSYNCTQETHGYGDNYRFVRGYIGVTFANRNTSTPTNSIYGWRPALRQISK